MKIRFSLLFILVAFAVNGQTKLTISGKTYTNSEDTWLGVDIPRTEKTTFVFKNNSITSINRYGYQLQAGDEGVKATNNNLDGAVITGNKFSWSGTDMIVIPHGLFAGHNINVVAKYNYLDDIPMGIIRKSASNMKNTGGGVAYNIVKGGVVGMVIKGMSNVNIYNNTFYNDRTTAQTWRPLIHIYTNTDNGNHSVSHSTKIYNNIFYTKYQTLSITIADAESLTGLECDYNVYWCESGTPRFSVNGSIKTFAQWQAMGYDAHSVVINPQFEDFENFVPAKRLDYGKDLGAEWKDGLATNAVWGTIDPATAVQNGVWQAGAVVRAAVNTPVVTTPAPPVFVNSVVEAYAPSKVEIVFTCKLGGVVPPDSSFIAMINSSPVDVEKVEILENKVILTLSDLLKLGEKATVSYVKPQVNPLQSTTGAQAETFTEKPVVNNSKTMVTDTDNESIKKQKITVYPNPATKYLIIDISNPVPGVVRTIRIFDFSGKLCMEKELETDESHKLPVNLKPGFYAMHIEEGSKITLIQKLIIVY